MLIFATGPVWGLLLGAMLGLERPTRRGIIGVALSVVGVGVVVLEGFGAQGESLIGDFAVLGAAVCVGAYSVLSMPLLRRYPPLAVAAYPILFSVSLLIVLALRQDLGLGWGTVGGGPWVAIGYSVIFATAFAFSAWQMGTSRITSTSATLAVGRPNNLSRALLAPDGSSGGRPDPAAGAHPEPLLQEAGDRPRLLGQGVENRRAAHRRGDGGRSPALAGDQRPDLILLTASRNLKRAARAQKFR